MSTIFDAVQPAPPDPILGLTEAFKKDSNPQKVNLGVGVFQDASGKTPLLQSVKEAQRRIVAGDAGKSYLPIEGDVHYGQCVQELLFGPDHSAIADRRVVTCHAPGGTGALRVAGDLLKNIHAKASIWLSDPTWDNHRGVFTAAGVPIRSYPYLDRQTNGLAFEQMIAGLAQIPEGDVVLLHGCCHNPTGVDPSPDQWSQIAQVLARRHLLPLIDIAYQGFADGLEVDAFGLRAVAQAVPQLLVCSSFSKNVGLYNERVGALSVLASTEVVAQSILSHIKVCIRRNYSNPPAHGAAIVSTILRDSSLRDQWEGEVKQMRDRINGMRQLFTDTLKAKGAAGDFSFITRQRGMFSFSGLTESQVEALREQHSIYIVRSGRINVAGMTEANMARLCEAIVQLL